MSRRHQPYLCMFPVVGILLTLCPSSSGQTEKKLEPIIVAPVTVELTQHLSPWDQMQKLGTDRFKLTSTVGSFTLNYSNLTPAGFTGGQFQALPAGYSSAQLEWKRSWGAVRGFRTLSCSRCTSDPVAARKLSGVAIEVPRVAFGTHLSTSVLQGDPQQPIRNNPSSKRKASQVRVAASRELKGGVKLVTEWSQSWQAARPGQRASRTRGIYMRLGRKTAKTDFAIAVRSHGEGLVSPATAVQDRDRSWLALDLRRTFKGHELQYSNQINAQKRVLSPRMPSINVREESLRYTFSPRHLPQLSAAQTWISQRSNGKREYEEDLRLAMNKGIKRLSLGFAYLRGTRFDEFALRPLWERAGLIGDAGIEFQKGRRLTVHYESSELMLRNTPQLLNMESVQVGTRMAYWQDRVAFMPAADYRHQRDSRGLLDMSLFNFALSVLLKMPRCVPASDLMISITARRLSAVSLPDQNTAGLILQWNLKRL